jgi:PleD family two-component response regulator
MYSRGHRASAKCLSVKALQKWSGNDTFVMAEARALQRMAHGAHNPSMHGRSSMTADDTRRRALVVDPDVRARTSAGLWLTEAGFYVCQATDFEAGRRALDAARPAVLVTAARLGPYNGLHLIITARAARYPIVTILVTQEDEDGVRREAARLDAGYLVKPLERESFLETLGVLSLRTEV